jgi:chemotaxis protein methyltransferase CheR
MISTFDHSELERFRDLIGHALGLRFDDSKFGLLADVLRRRVEATRQGSEAYLARLDRGAEDLNALAEELTVGETYFFRHIEQYRAFAEMALPDRLRRAHLAGTRLQILSAGCATGEEPYSLAIAAHTSTDQPARIVITGVDIKATAIERAIRGRYSAWVLRDTPPDVQQRWFRADGRDFVLNEAVRNAVRFVAANLADESLDVWRPESYDIVFCRNVLMYFTPSNAQALVARLARALRPGGYLFLGHAETLRGLSSDFHLRHTHGTFYYQRRDSVGVHSGQEALAGSHSATSDRPIAIADLLGATWVETIRRASERIEALVSAPGQAPSSSERLRPPPARTWEIGLVLELLREERFAEALGLMDTFPPEAGRDAEVLLLRAVLLTHSGQLTDAEDVCERLLGIDDLNAGAHYLLALCREGAGDRAAALHHDQVAIYLDPTFAMPHVHLGVLRRRAQDHQMARREFDEAMILLQREDPSRLLLFGGGFSREALVALCQAELNGNGAPA